MQYPGPDSPYIAQPIAYNAPLGSPTGTSAAARRSLLPGEVFASGVFLRLDILAAERRVCSVPVELPPKMKLPGTSSRACTAHLRLQRPCQLPV